MLNKITLMGRLTADPELRHTNDLIPVTTFTLAVDRDHSSGGERQTDFIDCVIWRHGAEFVQKNWSKGKMMTLSGRLQSRKYVDHDGNNRTAWEVNCENVYFCGDNKHD